jgi:glycosyltransferase involved in cell wall biosynthesis
MRLILSGGTGLRVLVVNAFSDRSEVGLWLGLAKAGVEIGLACDPSAPEQQVLQKAGITVDPITIRRRLDFAAVRELRRRLLRSRFDIIHATRNSGVSTMLIASRGMSFRRIAYRGTVGHVSWFDPASWLTYLNPRLDKIICVSDAVRRYFLSLGLPESRLVTIYKGFDVGWYSPANRMVLTAMGIPSDAFVVGFAGDMRPVKGVRELILSAHYLPEGGGIHYLLVGNARDRQLKKLASHSKIRDLIHFTGFREDAPGLIGACNAVVMPSRSREGIGKGAIEGMAQGVPPIVTSVGGLPEIVMANESGLVVPPENPAAIAEAIVRLASDPALCAALGTRAKERIQNCFSVQLAVDRTLKLYKELAQER